MTNYSKRSSSRRNSQRKLRSTKKGSGGSQIRIIAGKWRGRKLSVVAADGLRPTGDRVRETLFNWLMHDIPGSRCLDLFAGTGALGLEAASRGAKEVVLVEASTAVAEQLKAALIELDDSGGVSLLNVTANDFLLSNSSRFNVVFLDPPFDQRLHETTLNHLKNSHLINGALIYLELPTAERSLVDQMPAVFSVFKEKRFGDVTVFVLQYAEKD